MYEGNAAELQMTRTILEDGYYDNTAYSCEIITYNREEGVIYFLTRAEDLTVFSLDGIYECRIQEQEERIVCDGIIRERYWNKHGRNVVFEIKNGFYKKLLN